MTQSFRMINNKFYTKSDKRSKRDKTGKHLTHKQIQRQDFCDIYSTKPSL